MINWLRQLLGEQPRCPTCEVLKEQITHLRYENEKLLRYILEPKSEMVPAVAATAEPEPIAPRIIPWEVRKRMLEAEDRQKAALIEQSKKDRKKAIEELENRLDVKPLNLGEENVQSSTVEEHGGTHQQKEVSSQG